MPRQSKRPNESRQARPTDALRREVASLAARMMAEDGICDYGAAKRKATRQLGYSESDALPTNQEIEAALRDYQSLYQSEESQERLLVLRRCALEYMELLNQFHPYLTGAVLDGTAGRYAEVEIDLFADSSKDVEIFLLDSGIKFELAAVSTRSGSHPNIHQPETRLRLDCQDATLLLSIYPFSLERTRRRSPHTGQISGRASTETLAALLE